MDTAKKNVPKMFHCICKVTIMSDGIKFEGVSIQSKIDDMTIKSKIPRYDSPLDQMTPQRLGGSDLCMYTVLG